MVPPVIARPDVSKSFRCFRGVLSPAAGAGNGSEVVGQRLKRGLDQLGPVIENETGAIARHRADLGQAFDDFSDIRGRAE